MIQKKWFAFGICLFLMGVVPAVVWSQSDEEANVPADSDTGSVYDLFYLTEGADNQNSSNNSANSNTNQQESPQQTNVNTNTNANGNVNSTPAENANVNNANINQNINAGTNAGNGSEETAISLAECIIFERLEIYDSRCDELTRELNCPNYAGCLQECEDSKNVCFTAVARQSSQGYNTCVDFYNSCMDRCADLNPQCSKKYPPRNAEGEAQSFQLVDSSGDVRVTYLDNPTPADMQSVKDERSVQVGATIFTGDKASTRIMLPNGTAQMLGPNTYFRIVDYYSGDNVDETIAILKNGNARIKVSKPGDDEPGKKVEYVVITPLWKVEAKGTEFDLTVNENGTTQLATLSGEVELHDHLDKLIAAVPAGENLSADSDGNVDEYSSGVFFPSSTAYYVNAYGKIAIAGGIFIIAAAFIVTLVIILRRKKETKRNISPRKRI